MVGKPKKDTDILSEENKRKWFGHIRTYYGKASIIASGISGGFAIFAPLFPSYWSFCAGGIAAGAAFAAWSLSNADRDKIDDRSNTDFDGLVSAMEKSHAGLADAAAVSPNNKLAKNYIGNVLEKLRVLLEPEGKHNFVRVCIYRKDSGERKEDSDGDPLIDEVYRPDNESEATVSFTKYVFELGGRTDEPRWEFNSTKPPGSEFFDELFKKGRFECKTLEDLPALEKDDYYSGKSNRPEYESFVNIALKDEHNETFAMLTCDSIEKEFFDERRNRLIKAFLPLIKLALQDGATNVPEPKRRRDQIGLNVIPSLPGPKKPNPNTRKINRDGR